MCYLPFLQREKYLKAFCTKGEIHILHGFSINVTGVILDLYW